MDPDADADPSIFVIDLQERPTKINFFIKFSAYYFMKVHLHHVSKIKKPKEATKQ
jgi:hypothetical protein